MTGGDLGKKWEMIGRVRNRFRRNEPWIRLATTDDNEVVERCMKSLSFNVETLTTIFETCGLTRFKVKVLEKQVWFLKLLLLTVYIVKNSEIKQVFYRYM